MARGIGTFKILANRDIREAVKQTAAVALPPTPPPEPIPSTSRSVAEEAETLKRTRDASTDASNTLPPRKKKRKEAKSDDVVSFTRSTLPPDLLKCARQTSLNRENSGLISPHRLAPAPSTLLPL
jgi:hypothetical protein